MDIGQLIMWLLLLGTGALLVVFKDWVKQHHLKLELILGILLVFFRIWRGSGYIADGEWNRVVPLQLCSLSTYIALFYFLTKYKKLELYLFFFGFLGLSSFIDPDVAWSSARMSYILGFVYDHLIITLAPLYLVVIKDFKFGIKDIVIPYIVVVVLLFVSWPINYAWSGSNFFYIVEKPVFSDVFSEDRFSPWMYDLLYIFAFQFAFFVFNAISLLIIKLVNKTPYLGNKTISE